MPIHVRLLVGLVALVTGVVVAGAGIFEFLGEDASFPMAMIGMFSGAAGIYLIFQLVQDMPGTKAGLEQWSGESPGAAKATGLGCIAVGLMLIAVCIWVLVAGGMKRGGKGIGVGIALGGGLAYIGYVILALKPDSTERVETGG